MLVYNDQDQITPLINLKTRTETQWAHQAVNINPHLRWSAKDL